MESHAQLVLFMLLETINVEVMDMWWPSSRASNSQSGGFGFTPSLVHQVVSLNNRH